MAYGRWLFAASVLVSAHFAAACGGSTSVEDGGGGPGGSSSTQNGPSTGTQSTTSGTTTGGGGFGACGGPGECTVAVPGCCGVCGAPGLGDVEAINESEVQAFYDATCTKPEPCPDCPTATNPNLFSYCEQGQCVAALLQLHPFSACNAPSECVLRLGTGCCSCNDGFDWVAIAASQSSALEQAVCSPEETCPRCEPSPPANYFADCIDGHCALVIGL